MKPSVNLDILPHDALHGAASRWARREPLSPREAAWIHRWADWLVACLPGTSAATIRFVVAHIAVAGAEPCRRTGATTPHVLSDLLECLVLHRWPGAWEAAVRAPAFAAWGTQVATSKRAPVSGGFGPSIADPALATVYADLRSCTLSQLATCLRRGRARDLDSSSALGGSTEDNVPGLFRNSVEVLHGILEALPPEAGSRLQRRQLAEFAQRSLRVVHRTVPNLESCAARQIFLREIVRDTGGAVSPVGRSLTGYILPTGLPTARVAEVLCGLLADEGNRRQLRARHGSVSDQAEAVLGLAPPSLERRHLRPLKQLWAASLEAATGPPPTPASARRRVRRPGGGHPAAFRSEAWSRARQQVRVRKIKAHAVQAWEGSHRARQAVLYSHRVQRYEGVGWKASRVIDR